MNQLRYPSARRTETFDDYHGTRVADPFRWMEDMRSEEVAEWLAAQTRVTDAYLGSRPCGPSLRSRIDALSRLGTRSVPVLAGERWIQARNPGDLEQPALFLLASPDDEGRLLLDPRSLPEGAVVQEWHVSRDGRLLLWAESIAGSDWRTWRVLEIESGRRTDVVTGAKLWAEWLPDSSGFVYITFDAGGDEAARRTAVPQLKLHRLGTDPADDELLYEDRERPRYFKPAFTADGETLVLDILMGRDPVGETLVAPAAGPWSFRTLATSDQPLSFAGQRDGRLLYATTDGAPNGRVVAIDPRDPRRDAWRTAVPETGVPMRLHYTVHVQEDLVVAVRDQFGQSRITVYPTGGDPLELDLPEGSHVAGVQVLPGAKALLQLTTPAAQVEIHDADLRTGAVELRWRPEGTAELDLEVDLVWAPSQDGTKVPMTIVKPRGAAADVPVVLEGYGGGGDIMEPFEYRPWKVAWFEAGGAVATAHLRGDGALGAGWYAAGEGAKGKERAIQDMIGCGRWLAANLTRPGRICVTGRSNGGMLAAASMMREPELFGACIPEVALMDPLRLHLFGLGSLMRQEYGVSTDPADFAAMIAYSPIHTVRPGVFPPTLVTCHGGDDRIPPGGPFKFTSLLQEAQAGDAPVLLLFRADAGHHGGSLSGEVEERSAIVTFLAATFGIAGCAGSEEKTGAATATA